MTAPAAILHFCDFDAFYQTLGLPRIPILADFDVLTFDDSVRVGVTFMPPFRKDWYQLVFKINPAKPVLLNTERIEVTNSVILFNSPNHVYSWQLDTDLRGFILFFKPDFMTSLPHVEHEFPFFGLTESNLITVDSLVVEEFASQFRQMLASSQREGAFRRQTLQALLLAFLYQCKSIYYHQQQQKNEQPRSVVIAARFQQLVNALFLEKKTVAAYAELLNLTPNYLNERIKEATGKNARQFIVDRVLTEAKNLLLHTTLDVKSIAHTLRFDEPTNFVKFFRKQVGCTPGQFRQRT